MGKEVIYEGQGPMHDSMLRNVLVFPLFLTGRVSLTHEKPVT